MPRVTSICPNRVDRGRDGDIGGEDQLDAEGEAGALHRDHDGLVSCCPDTCHGSMPFSPTNDEAVRADARTEVGEVEAGGEVVADRVDEPDAQLGVALQLAVRVGEQRCSSSKSAALRFSGRFRPISRMCPRRSVRILGSLMAPKLSPLPGR